MNDLSVLLVDSDEMQLTYTTSLISMIRYPVCQLSCARSVAQAIGIIGRTGIDLVMTDFRLEDGTGFELLARVKALNPAIDVVILTTNTDTREAVKSMKGGAYDYLLKPVRQDVIESLLTHLVERHTLIRENMLLKHDQERSAAPGTVISKSEAMQQILNLAYRSAQSSATVLITGESGTGKELIARSIHLSSARRDRPFVVVNMAALPESLIESELFGHRKGAFTGASEDRIGRFEQADGGTLFIDEAGEIPPSIQVKLLRVLQFGEIERVGDSRSIRVEIRIIAATNRNLEEMIARKEFRLDLYYRLNVVSISIPPLREHREDIPTLIRHFMETYAKKNNKQVSGISQEALDLLMKYRYPGNIRELENIVERAIVFTRREIITTDDLPPSIGEGSARQLFDPSDIRQDFDEKLEAFEREMLLHALTESSGNQSGAARRLGISERKLRYRMERLRLPNAEYLEA